MKLPGWLLSTAQRIKGVKSPDPTYHSSMYYDLAQKRQTEVDDINGKIVELTAETEAKAPVNELLMQLVHEAQHLKAGSPKMPIDMLFEKAVAVSPELNRGCSIS